MLVTWWSVLVESRRSPVRRNTKGWVGKVLMTTDGRNQNRRISRVWSPYFYLIALETEHWFDSRQSLESCPEQFEFIVSFTLGE